MKKIVTLLITKKSFYQNSLKKLFQKILIDFFKCFIELCPTGKGDQSHMIPGNTPKLLEWFRHLLRLEDRRFVIHPTFIFFIVNLKQRHDALKLGNLYAKRCCPDISFKDLKEKINNGEFNALRNLYYFGRDIKGTPQYFNYQSIGSANFLRHLRISSDNKKPSMYS